MRGFPDQTPTWDWDCPGKAGDTASRFGANPPRPATDRSHPANWLRCPRHPDHPAGFGRPVPNVSTPHPFSDNEIEFLRRHRVVALPSETFHVPAANPRGARGRRNLFPAILPGHNPAHAPAKDWYKGNSLPGLKYKGYRACFP